MSERTELYFPLQWERLKPAITPPFALQLLRPRDLGE